MFCGTLKSSFIEKLHNRNSETAGKSESAEASKMEEKSRQHVRRHLPVPTGPHTVGIVDFMCERGENGSFFRLYYPTTKTDIYKRDRQWPLWLPRKQYGIGYAHFMRKSTKLFGKLFNWIGGDVYVPALWQAVPLRSNTPYPVVIFSHGLGGNRTTYTTMCVELASQGFVVAALEHRDGSASMTLCLKNNNRSSIRHCHDDNELDTTDNAHHHHHHQPQNHDHNKNHKNNHHHNHRRRLSHHDHNHHHYFKEEWKWFEHVERWDDFDYRNGQMYKRVEECRDVLNLLTEINEGSNVINTLGFSFDTKHFKGQLDMSRVSVIGHSFGGASCIATLAKEPRFKVGIVLDGWMHPVEESLPSQVKQPALMLNMETFHWRKNIEQMQAMCTDTEADRPLITIRGTCHQSVTDFQFLCRLPVGRVMEVRYKLDPQRCMEMTCKATLGFLNKHLVLENRPHYDDVLSGEHHLIIKGTNVDMDGPNNGPQV